MFILSAILKFIYSALDIYKTAIFILITLSWLSVLNIINPRQQLISNIMYFLQSVTEPILKHIRKVIPNIGSFDVSLLVLLLAIHFIKILIEEFLR